MPRAFLICYLKSLCIFPNALKLQPRIPQISRKCLEAKFRGQVQRPSSTSERQGKKLWAVPRSIYQLYKKFWAISTIKWRRKKICRKTKNSNLIGSFSALCEISHIRILPASGCISIHLISNFSLLLTDPLKPGLFYKQFCHWLTFPPKL